MNRTLRYLLVTAMLVTLALVTTVSVSASNDCVLVDTGSSLELQGDCTTDSTVFVPDGFTLDGNGHTITGVDPVGGHFVGAVVRNAGSVAHVTDVTVTVDALANVCDAGDNRLRGIMFQGANGSITRSTVVDLNQGPSGCQEGNAIEIRNIGDMPGVAEVTVAHNVVDRYQKSGIVANGDVDVVIEHNRVGQSATQANLAANAIQVGFGGTGMVMHNSIDGNSWHLPTDVATAVLLYDSDGVTVSKNNFGGNADVGIYIFGDNNIVDNNKVFESGADSTYDIGIGDYGIGNSVTNNKVKGYSTPYEGVVGGNNKVVGSPN